MTPPTTPRDALGAGPPDTDAQALWHAAQAHNLLMPQDPTPYDLQWAQAHALTALALAIAAPLLPMPVPPPPEATR